MTVDRILDVSDAPADLSIDLGCLAVRRAGSPTLRVPVDEIGAVVLAHPGVRVSLAALAALASQGVVVVVADGKRLPVAVTLPLVGHFAQTQRFLAQVAASRPTCKRLWRQVVKAKLRAQGLCLRESLDVDGGLPDLAARVRSGDPDNVEAMAARKYWSLLFAPIPSFKREPGADPVNSALDYGYAVLRSMVARAIVCAGLHPTLGLQHQSRTNPFCLADDLMEPFRPWVDRAVLRLATTGAVQDSLDRRAKAALIEPMLARYRAQGEVRTMSDVLARVARSLAAVYLGERRDLWLPDLEGVPDDLADDP